MTPDLSKDEVYKILNEIIADDSLRLYDICWQVEHLTVSDEYGFSRQDKKFIERQNKLFKDFKFEPGRLRSYSRRTQKSEYISIDTSCNEGIRYHLSFPLISVDRQRVVIENTEDCHCMLGGQGSKDLFVKRNGRWENEKSFDRWISREIHKDFPELLDKNTSGPERFGSRILMYSINLNAEMLAQPGTIK